MLKTYAELNLAKLRDEVGLDFAHYTYTGGRCSCCYFPHDLPSVYWKGKTKAEKLANREKGKESEEYEYILFKNAENGGGEVKKTDRICMRTDWYYRNYIGPVYIEWKMSEDKLIKTCELLQEQLGAEYEVIKPDDVLKCIKIRYIGEEIK